MSCNCLNFRINAAGYPFTWMSNYGGRVQFNSMPSYVSANMAYRLQNNWMNQGNMFSGCTGFAPGYQMGGVQYPVSTYPVQGAGMQYGGVDMSTVQGYIDGRKTRIGVIANNTTQNLGAYKTQLQGLLADESLTSEQKNQIQQLLTKITLLFNGVIKFIEFEQ